MKEKNDKKILRFDDTEQDEMILDEAQEVTSEGDVEEIIETELAEAIGEPIAGISEDEGSFSVIEPQVEEEVKEVPAVEKPVQKKEKTATQARAGHKRVLQGKVVSSKPNKTIVLRIERQVAHPLYKKYYKRSKNVMAHDPQNECRTGDVVKVRECRPLSAHKRWELVEIIERAK